MDAEQGLRVLAVANPRNSLDRVRLGAHPVWPSANAPAVFAAEGGHRAAAKGGHASRPLWIHGRTTLHFLVH